MRVGWQVRVEDNSPRYFGYAELGVCKRRKRVDDNSGYDGEIVFQVIMPMPTHARCSDNSYTTIEDE